MRIGEVIRNWRLLEHMTLAQASVMVGIPLATLARIEKGGRIEDRTMVVLIRFLFD
jgi:transcriptional regulator with XRE-family HTH domain